MRGKRGRNFGISSFYKKYEQKFYHLSLCYKYHYISGIWSGQMESEE